MTNKEILREINSLPLEAQRQKKVAVSPSRPMTSYAKSIVN